MLKIVYIIYNEMTIMANQYHLYKKSFIIKPTGVSS